MNRNLNILAGIILLSAAVVQFFWPEAYATALAMTGLEDQYHNWFPLIVIAGREIIRRFFSPWPLKLVLVDVVAYAVACYFITDVWLIIVATGVVLMFTEDYKLSVASEYVYNKRLKW